MYFHLIILLIIGAGIPGTIAFPDDRTIPEAVDSASDLSDLYTMFIVINEISALIHSLSTARISDCNLLIRAIKKASASTIFEIFFFEWRTVVWSFPPKALPTSV